MVRKTREEALKTKESIVNVAKELFCKNGYDKTNLSDIADYAGVTRGAVYWHFQNKDELFIELWKKMIKTDSNFYIGLDDANDIDGPILVFIENWLHGIVDFLTKDDNQTFIKIILAIVWGKQGSKRIRNMVKEVHSGALNHVKVLLEKAINHGELNKNADAKFIANFICATIDGYMMYYIDGKNKDIVDNNSLVTLNIMNLIKNFRS